MHRLRIVDRHQEIQRVRADLELTGFPRLQMFILVSLTGLAGLAASYLLLHSGVTTMWSRYLVSFGIAYLAFLLLLWLWLRSRGEAFNEFPDVSGFSPGSSGSHACRPEFSGHGGEFAGGGASGSFDAPAVDAVASADPGPVGEALSSAVGAEELAIPLVAIILVAAMAFSSLFIVYSAPVLFAELIVDGVLSASLYRKLRGLQTRHWLDTAVRRTAWPFALTAIVVSAAGWAMALYAPDAHSLGEVIAYAKAIG
jgi:hypothetical protein